MPRHTTFDELHDASGRKLVTTQFVVDGPMTFTVRTIEHVESPLAEEWSRDAIKRAREMRDYIGKIEGWSVAA